MDISNIKSVVGLPKLTKDPEASFSLGRDSAGAGSSAPKSEAALEMSEGGLESAVADIQSFVQVVKRGLQFSVDDSSGEVVVKVIDTDSGKLIRQIPSEELLKLAERLDDVRSLMFEAKA